MFSVTSISKNLKNKQTNKPKMFKQINNNPKSIKSQENARVPGSKTIKNYKININNEVNINDELYNKIISLNK